MLLDRIHISFFKVSWISPESDLEWGDRLLGCTLCLFSTAVVRTDVVIFSERRSKVPKVSLDLIWDKVISLTSRSQEWSFWASFGLILD